MKFRCFLLLYIIILPNELMIFGKTGDLCIHKLVKGRLVTEGFCETPNEQEIITQLRNNVEAAKEREKLKTWYKASNNFYYKMFLDQVSYATAKANCQEKGANLASVGVRDSSIRNHLISLAIGQNVWIGLNDIEHEGNFIWEDGVVSTADNTPWLDKQPDDYEGKEDCVHSTGNSLNDVDCSVLLPYICEIFV